MGLASDEMIQRGCCFIGKLTCGDTHADTRTEWSVGCLIATPPFYLYLASQRSRAMGEPGRHQRQVCEGTWSSAARVTCDYRSEDLNEYTIFGPFAASLCGAGNSQSAVYPIIAPCLYAPPEQLGVQLLCWGAILEDLRRKVSELLIPNFNEITSWSLDSNCWQPQRNEFALMQRCRLYSEDKTQKQLPLKQEH